MQEIVVLLCYLWFEDNQTRISVVYLKNIRVMESHERKWGGREGGRNMFTDGDALLACLLASFKVAGDGNMLCCIVYFLSLEWGTAKSYWSKINRWRRTEMFSWIHCELFVANTQLSSNSCSRRSAEHFYLHVSSFEYFTIVHHCNSSGLVRLSAYYLFLNLNRFYI